MIDCLNDEDGTLNKEEEEDQSADDLAEADVIVKGGRKKSKPQIAISAPKPAAVVSSPLPKQQPSSGLLEYVVDQKGCGSESLVVKSATVGKNSGQASCTGGSRRNSLAGGAVDPQSKKQSAPQMSKYSPFNPATTTHSHQLFPNYPRTTLLPTLDTQFDFNLMGNDMGLAALNANDFNLMGIWNNASTTQQQLRSYFDICPQQPQQQSYDSTPRYTMNQHPMATSGTTTSQNPINNLVSDLFGDISNMF